MNIDQRFMLAALRNVWGICKVAPSPLRDALQAKSDSYFTMVSQGQIKTASGNGQMAELDIQSGAPTPSLLLSMWVYLVDMFDNSTTDLKCGGNNAPTDTQVEAQMETYLRPITGYTNNWMYISK